MKKTLSKEHKKKIGETNSKRMKQFWKDGRATKKQLENVTKSSIRRKEKYGYVNSPEARKKLSKTWKKRYKKGEISHGFMKGQFKKGFDKRRVKTQFKMGHTVDEKTREAVRKNRRTQIFPLKDSSIEVKIQDYLKELKLDFFTHQYMNDIKHSYQCDIFIPCLNLVIECDGDYWHKYPTGTQMDSIRTKELIEKGFKVLRLWEREIKVMDVSEFKNRLKIYGGTDGI